MQKTVLIFICVVCTALCHSCGNASSEYKEPVFREKGQLDAVILNDTLDMFYPFEMAVSDNHVLVLASNGSSYLQAYDKCTGAYAGGFILKGRGPGEISSAGNMTFDGEEGIVSVYDPRTSKIVSYRLLEDGLLELEYVSEKSFADIGKPLRRVWDLKEEGYFIDGQIGVEDGIQGRFQIINEDGLQSQWNRFPVDDETEKMAYFSTLSTISPDRRHFADATLYGAILETFELSGGIISPGGCRRFLQPVFDFEDGVIVPKDKTTFGFTSLCATDDCIFGVYVGNSDADTFNNISTFDWNGKEMCRYETDCNNLRIGCHHADDRKIYAVAANPDRTFSLVYYDLDRAR